MFCAGLQGANQPMICSEDFERGRRAHMHDFSCLKVRCSVFSLKASSKACDALHTSIIHC